MLGSARPGARLSRLPGCSTQLALRPQRSTVALPLDALMRNFTCMLPHAVLSNSLTRILSFLSL